MGPGGARRPAAGQSSRGVPGRRLRRRAGLRGRGNAVAAHLYVPALQTGGRRLHPAERSPGPRRRHRPHPRRAGKVPRPGGQRSSALRRELRDRESAGHDQDVPRAVRRAERAPGGRVPLPPAGRAPGGRAEGHRGPLRGRADPGRAQRRLLRAHPARPADGRGAGGGPGPVLRPQPGLHAHHPGPPAGRRHLPPGRRRLAGSASVPAGFGDGLRGRHQRGAGRSRHHRERGRQRGGRRQARLHLHPRPDQVLPERGAAPGQRSSPTGSINRKPSSGSSTAWTSW